MATNVYTHAKFLMATDMLGWVLPSAVFRGMLVGASYAFSPAHISVSDVVAHEVNHPSYSRQNIVGRLATEDMPNDRALLRASNTLYPLLDGVTPAGIIIYRRYGPNDITPATDLLVCHVGFAPSAADGKNFLVEYDPAGVIALTAC